MNRDDILLTQIDVHNDLDPDDVISMVDIRVKLEDGKKVSISGITEINQEDLNTEFANQSARFAYFAVLCAEARVARDTAEDAYKRDEASAFVEYKNDDDLIPTGSKTVTDGYANKLVTQDDACMELKKLYIEAEREFRVMEALVRALEMRANMLISLGAQLRSEADMDGMRISNRDPGDVARQTIKNRKRS